MNETAEPAVVVCDANVLYSIVMTDLIISLGNAELFHPRWTRQIHDEWMRNLLADRPDLDPSKVERRRRQMDQAIDDCLIEGYQHLIPSLTLPDEADCHVLAAAIHGQRDDLFVLQAFVSDVNADLFGADAPTPQQQSLASRNVFVQDVQAAVCSRTNSSACLSKAWLANCTASLMASKLTLSFHSSTIISHAIPLATCSSTSATNTREPRNVGLP
jgi:hypothetical protein